MKNLARVIALFVCLAAVSCSAPQRVELTTSYRLADSSAPDESAFALDIDGRAVDRLPADWGTPAATEAEIITGPANQLRAASPSAAESVLIRQAQGLPEAGFSEMFGNVETVAGSTVIVPRQSVTVLAIGLSGAAPDSSAPRPIEMLFEARAGEPSLRLRAIRRATEEEAAMNRLDSRETQTLRIPWPLPARDGEFEVAIPASRGLGRATVWSFKARPLTDSEATHAREVVTGLTAPAPVSGSGASLAKAIRDAADQKDVRKAIEFAALKSGASLTTETALLIDDKALDRLAKSAAEALEQPGSDAGWLLEAATIKTLAQLSSEGSLGRALSASLSARYGEVGRDPSNLAYIARRSASGQDFEKRLEAEHLILLNDSSPGARVRALDWLTQRNAAPAGYDPMATARQRSDAINRHLQSLEERP